MSGGHKRRAQSLTLDKILMEKLKPAYFNLIHFLHKIALVVVFIGLLGYILAELKRQNIDLVRMIFNSETLQFLR